MYGLLGKKLGHSFSKAIHEELTNTPYQLVEVENLDQFFSNPQFDGLNVTIPYKQDVITYLDELSPEAKETNAVNTIIFRSGKLKGYNTDYFGLAKALSYNNISITNKSVLIMGNGSTSRTISYYCTKNFAQKIVVLARNPKENEYNFSDVENYKHFDIIFNATPVGMFPNNNQPQLLNLALFPNLTSVIDVVYNPLRSNLLIEAERLGIKTVNGLFMLIHQASVSIKLFHNITINQNRLSKFYKKLLLEKLNLTFIGMPMSGKSFFNRLCSEKYNKSLVDIDNEITKYTNDSVSNIFLKNGEKYFREIESNIIEFHSKLNNQAISCGGGVILSKENMVNLKQNGIIIFIDAPLSLLNKINPKDRPLLRDKSNLEKLYKERYDKYINYADIIINKSNFDENSIMKQIEVKLYEYIGT